MKHEFTATTPLGVTVELESGDLRVIAAPGDRVVVTLSGDGAEATRVDQRDRAITIVGPRSRGFLGRAQHLDIEVVVPEHTDLAARLGSAEVTATGPLGTVTIVTGSGSVSLEEVSGASSVKTGSGDITVTSVDATVDLKTGSGDIRVARLGEEGRLTTGSGEIEVALARAAVWLKSGSGDLAVGTAEGDASLLSASGDLRIGRIGRGQAQLKNASGDIHVGLPAGTPVWTDVSSTTGRVRSGLAPTGAPADGQDFVEILAKTVTGDIYLDQI